MGKLTIFENIIDKKINSLHTAFLAKVISVNGNEADIQPLEYESPTLPNTPIIRSARNKSEAEIIQSGDVVVCVCCSPFTSRAKRGEMPTADDPVDRFSFSGAIIVGIL